LSKDQQRPPAGPSAEQRTIPPPRGRSTAPAPSRNGADGGSIPSERPGLSSPTRRGVENCPGTGTSAAQALISMPSPARQVLANSSQAHSERGSRWSPSFVAVENPPHSSRNVDGMIETGNWPCAGHERALWRGGICPDRGIFRRRWQLAGKSGPRSPRKQRRERGPGGTKYVPLRLPKRVDAPHQATMKPRPGMETRCTRGSSGKVSAVAPCGRRGRWLASRNLVHDSAKGSDWGSAGVDPARERGRNV